MVGIAARTRESSVTLPSSRGTLKSTRTKTRLPATSTSRMVSLSMGRSAALLPPSGGGTGAGGKLRGHERQEVGATAAVAPLVVVPGDDLDHRPAKHHGARRVDDRGARVAAEVRRHQRLVRYAQDALHRPGCCGAERVVDLLCGGRPRDVGGEVDDAHRGR